MTTLLYKLLFEEHTVDIEEAAKTANDAAAMDYAIFYGRPDGQHLYVLIDTKNARSSMAKAGRRMSMFEWFTDVSDSIKGVLYLQDNEDGKTFSVTNSAAINGFGPLLYELAMSEISPKYLISDTKVSPAAMSLWVKFHERSDVSKTPIESLYRWPCEEVVLSRMHLAANHLVKQHSDKLDALALIERRIADCRQGNTNMMLSTDDFFKELSKFIELKYLPMLFAYSMQHSSPMTIKVLKNEGMILGSELMRKFELKKSEFTNEIDSAATDFFSRMYRA